MRYSTLLPATIIVAAMAPAPALWAQDVKPTTAADFVTQAAISDMYEAQAGKLAESKGHAAGVKSFGRRMVAAHTKTTANLKAAVKKAGLNIAPPSQLDAKHQQLLDQLRSASGADFDQTYLSQQQVAHQDALKLMRTYASSGDNDSLKQAAAKTVPVINSHIAMLAKLKAAQ